MYTYCAFETAWEKNKVSPWCSIFNKSDLMVIYFKYIPNYCLIFFNGVQNGYFNIKCLSNKKKSIS